MLHAQCSLTAVQEWDVKRLCFEADTEPYAKERDAKILQLAEAAGVEVHTPISHTLFVSLGLLVCSHPWRWSSSCGAHVRLEWGFL